MNTHFYKIVDCLLNNYIYIRPLICLELQEFEAITPGYVIRTKGLLYIAEGAVLGSSPITQTDVIHNNMQSASTWDSQKEVDLSIKSLESHYSKKFYIFVFIAH